MSRSKSRRAAARDGGASRASPAFIVARGDAEPASARRGPVPSEHEARARVGTSEAAEGDLPEARNNMPRRFVFRRGEKSDPGGRFHVRHDAPNDSFRRLFIPSALIRSSEKHRHPHRPPRSPPTSASNASFAADSALSSSVAPASASASAFLRNAAARSRGCVPASPPPAPRARARRRRPNRVFFDDLKHDDVLPRLLALRDLAPHGDGVEALRRERRVERSSNPYPPHRPHVCAMTHFAGRAADTDEFFAIIASDAGAEPRRHLASAAAPSAEAARSDPR